METKKQFRASLMAIICSVLFVCPANSTLLRGYVKTDKAQSQLANFNQAISGNENQSNYDAASVDDATTGDAQGVNAQSGDATTGSAAVSGSFPQGFRGTWRCVSEVIDSQVDSVPVGQQVISEIDFVKAPSGKVAAQWNQPGWSETQASIVPYGGAEANLDRTNYYRNDAGPWWAARSSDHFRQLSAGQMVAESYVDQYVDGDYKGRYRTKSVLYRLSDPPASSDLALSGK